MKTTIKLSKTRSFTVQPSGRGVAIECRGAGVVMLSDVMTADQAGALIFGLEQALEAGQIASERSAACMPFPDLGMGGSSTACDDQLRAA